MALNPYTTTKEDRKNRIIDYLTNEGNKRVKDVLNYCIKEGIGSKSTVTEAIQELLAEGILNSGKERRNSKSYSLSVNSDNLLLVIPKDLDNIFEQFKKFIDKVKQFEKKKKFENRIEIEAIGTSKKANLVQKDGASLLQYDMIEIINDVYLFNFVVILPARLHDENLINRLYSIYFNKISEMYLYVISDLSTENSPFNSDIDQQLLLYVNYMDSKGQNLWGRLYEIVKISEIMQIEDDLDNLLKLLWSKNTEPFLLLYKQIETSETKLLLSANYRNLDTVSKYDTDKKIEEFLYNLKKDKDQVIQRTMGFQIAESDNI
ncbi:hypothetical protein [Candidatus Nitrosocosmicus franklandus]|nr:hypothetical protein [Candidatus Nitrosocosmicus franklandus]